MNIYSDTIREIGRKVKDGISTWNEATIEFNKRTGLDLSVEAFRSRYRNLHDEYEPTKEEKVNEEYETHNEDGTIDIVKSVWFDKDEEKTPETILSKFGYSVNEWEIVSWSFGQWEVAIKDEANRTCSTIRAKIKPKQNKLSNKEIIEITNKVLQENIKPLKIDKKGVLEGLDDDKMLVLSVADLHLGRYCNELDSGFNYDLDIASEYFRYIISELIRLQEQKKNGKLLYTIGNDFFNYDNTSGTTTKGTQLVSSATYRELYKRGLELQIQALKSIREYFNQIKVVLVQGNHDEILDYTLYLALQQIFKDDDVITFKEDYKKTQVEQFGENAIFMDHGDVNYKRYIQSLPSLFPRVYGDTTYRYALLHHLHSQQSIDESNGITSYRLSTIAPTDEYEYKNKFGTVLGNQPLFELDRNNGLESISYIRVKK